MNQWAGAVDIRILRVTNDIIGAAGELRMIIEGVSAEDRGYLEQEIDRLQAAAHRIAAFTEHLAEPKN